MGILDTIKSKNTTKSTALSYSFGDMDYNWFSNWFNKTSTQEQTSIQNTTTTHLTNYYQNTYDQSVNIIDSSPFSTLKKGDMGALAAQPSQNVSASAEQTAKTDQTSKTDMTGLLFIVALAGIGLYAYKEFQTGGVL